MEPRKEENVELRSTLRRLLEPINYLDFPVVIEMTTETKFEKFTERKEDEEFLEIIKRSADLLMNRVYVNPIGKVWTEWCKPAYRKSAGRLSGGGRAGDYSPKGFRVSGYDNKRQVGQYHIFRGKGIPAREYWRMVCQELQL